MPPTLPPELERSVVDYVDDDRTLESCALVCGRLCYWAQSRLFHSIYIPLGSDKPGPCMRRVGRLVAILETSPHLLTFVRSINMQRCAPSVLAALASLRWDSLEALRLQRIPRADKDGAFESIRLLISAPALRSLELYFGRSNPWNAGYLRSLLVHCSSTITHLGLVGWYDGSAAAVGYSPPPAALQSQPLPRINSLKLIGSIGAVAEFNDPTFPLDLSHVRHLDYYLSPHDSLGLLLRRIGLESLKVNVEDGTLENFDFGLPSLRRIECNFTCATESVLGRVPDGNRITNLVLTTSHDNWHFDNNDIYRSYRHYAGPDVERMVLRKLPYLRALVVEVTVLPQYASPHGLRIPPPNRELVVRNIEESMPRLTEMGIVSVSFLRYIWNDDPTERRRRQDREARFGH